MAILMNLNAECYDTSQGNTLKDQSGNGYDATINGATFDSVNQVFQFDGSGERDGDPTGDYLGLNTNGTSTDPSVRTEGVTYILRMRFTGNQSQGHGILGYGTINHMEYRGSIGSGYWRTEAKLQNGYSFGAGTPSIQPVLNEWFTLAIVFDNTTAGRPVKWYMNGVLFYTGSMTGGTNPDTEYFAPNRFGSSTGSGSYLYVQSFLGELKQFITYDKVYTDDEVYNLVNRSMSLNGAGDLYAKELDETVDPTHTPLVDYRTWVEGETIASGFSRNGSSAENMIIKAPGPFGETLVWESRPELEGENNYSCGGWNSAVVNIDSTKLYRFSVWMRNSGTVDTGSFYLGLEGYNSSGVDIGIIENGNGTINTNPYFDYAGISSLPSEWTLIVGHVYPHDSTETTAHPDSGRYNLEGTKISNGGGNISGDAKWQVDCAKTRHRTYHYYATSQSSHLQFAFPRIEVCDGTEPTIQQLINNYEIQFQNSKLRCGLLDETTTITENMKRMKDGTIHINGEFSEVD